MLKFRNNKFTAHQIHYSNKLHVFSYHHRVLIAVENQQAHDTSPFTLSESIKNTNFPAGNELFYLIY